MEMHDDTRSRGACSGQRPPTERGLEVVCVHDARASGADRVGNFSGVQPTAEEAKSRLSGIDGGRISRDQGDVLAEGVTYKPHQVSDRTLLASSDAVPVMNEEDQCPLWPCRGTGSHQAQRVSRLLAAKNATLIRERRYHEDSRAKSP